MTKAQCIVEALENLLAESEADKSHDDFGNGFDSGVKCASDVARKALRNK